MALRRPKTSIAAARRWKRCKVGMCLATVANWLNGSTGSAYAEMAWNKCRGKHRGDRTPPAGVPVFWHNPRSKYGHIALSVGNGRVRSTDWPRRGQVGEVSVNELTKRWGLRYLGWTSNFAVPKIPGVRGTS